MEAKECQAKESLAVFIITATPKSVAPIGGLSKKKGKEAQDLPPTLKRKTVPTDTQPDPLANPG